jgi:hypothetical protein
MGGLGCQLITQQAHEPARLLLDGISLDVVKPEGIAHLALAPAASLAACR